MEYGDVCTLNKCFNDLKNMGPRNAKRFTEEYVNSVLLWGIHDYAVIAAAAEWGQKEIKKESFCDRDSLKEHLNLEDDTQWTGNLRCGIEYNVRFFTFLIFIFNHVDIRSSTSNGKLFWKIPRFRLIKREYVATICTTAMLSVPMGYTYKISVVYSS